MNTFTKWLNTFLEEKNAPHQSWEIKATQGTDVVSIIVTNNNWTVSEKGGNSTEYIGDCETSISENVNLKFGKNTIRVQVSTPDKIFASEVIVNYNAILSEYHALIIGVEEYDDDNINDLSEPVNDAQKLSDVLSQNYTFKKENITFLRNPTKSEIIGTLHKMRYSISEKDNLLIFYAGHGFWDEEMGNGYWLPRDAAHDNPVNWLPNTDLTNSRLRNYKRMESRRIVFSLGVTYQTALSQVKEIPKLIEDIIQTARNRSRRR